jgi:hypothetical protein
MSAANTLIYVPMRNSLAGRVCAYFMRDPDEELSSVDIALKFDVSQNSVASSLEQCVRAGLLVCRKGQANVYGAGPRLAGDSGLASSPAWLQPQANQPAPASRLANRSAGLPAPEALQVESGVAMPPARAGLSGRRFDVVFAAMAVGDSFACSLDATKRLCQAAHAYGKPLGRTFASRVVDEKTARIWRTK